MGRALARAFHRAGLRDIVAEPRPIALPPAIHRQLVGPALAAAVETGTLEARAYRHWLAAAQDAERAGYHSDTFVGMVVSQPASPSRAARRSPGNTAPGRRGSVSRMAIMTRPLGRTQADVTILGYGAMELRGLPRGPEIADEDAGRLLNAVLDGGINLIDTSPDYGRSEELIGRYVGHRRDEFFLASKCGCLIELPADALPPYPHDYSPGNVRAAVEQSLRRLRTDHLDLVQVHMSPDRATLEDHHTVETLQGLRDEGKVRFIGMSGILPDLPDHLAMNVFDAFQIPYSAVQRDHEELIAEAAGKGAGTLIRGGAARGAASEEKNWRTGPLTQEPGLGQRNWDTSGIEDLLADAGPIRDGVRPPLHPQPPGPVDHHRRHREPGAPGRQHRDSREGALARRPLRRGEKATPAIKACQLSLTRPV